METPRLRLRLDNVVTQGQMVREKGDEAVQPLGPKMHVPGTC